MSIKISLLCLLFYCKVRSLDHECEQLALGMESGAISNAQISASSQNDDNHAAVQGRLHFKETSTKAGAWSALTADVSQWLQVDLGNQDTKVTRVATQGRNYRGNWPLGFHSQWVISYKLQYSDDGVNFQYYKEQGQSVYKVKTHDFAKSLVDKLELNTSLYKKSNLP